MGTYVYDDGSSITDLGGVVTSTYATDQREQDKLGQFYPQGTNWWESLATYGATRAIDSHFGPKELDKTAQPATFAGQNGQTYTSGSAVPAGGGMSGLVLLGIGLAAAVLLLR